MWTVIYYLSAHNTARVLLSVSWAVIGFSSFAAIILGIVHHKPAVRAGWILLASYVIFSAIAAAYSNIVQYTLNRTLPFPSVNDFIYLAIAYPSLVGGMYFFMRRLTASKRDYGSILDTAIVTVGLAMFTVIYWVIPSAVSTTGLGAKLLSICYPLYDIAAWALLIRILINGVRIRAIQLIALGAFGNIVADVVLGYRDFHGGWTIGTIADLGWVLFNVCFGAAALHPSMKSLGAEGTKTHKTSSWRMVLLAVTALIAPLILVLETIYGQVEKVAIPIAIFSAVLYLLVLSRVYILVREISQRESEILMEKKKYEAFSIVAHQLRTPVTAVRQYLDMVLGGYAGKISKKQQEFIEQASMGNNRLLELIEKLLNMGQAEVDKLQLQKTSTEMVGIIQAVINEQQAKIANRHQDVVFIHNDNEIYILCDTSKIRMVLENIIDNASKYSPANKKIIIKIVKLKTSAKISIKDTGVGIAQSDFDKLFLKYSRIDNSLSKTVGGTGLGLYWAKQIIELHKGTIKISSVPDFGTTVKITLPL